MIDIFCQNEDIMIDLNDKTNLFNDDIDFLLKTVSNNIIDDKLLSGTTKQ